MKFVQEVEYTYKINQLIENVKMLNQIIFHKILINSKCFWLSFSKSCFIPYSDGFSSEVSDIEWV